MMESTSNISTVKDDTCKSKFFEHAVVTWKIRNFSFSDQQNYGLRSIPFNFNTVVPSCWYLALEWMPATESPASIHLVRKKWNSEPEKPIRGSIRFGTAASEDEISWNPNVYYGIIHNQIVFSTHIDINLKFVNTTFKVLCDIFVYNEPTPEPFVFSPATAYALQQVPVYVKQLHGDQKFHDVTIVCENGQVTAHRSILSSRSAVFRKFFEVDSKDNRIFINFSSEVTMQQLVYYMYCNSLDCFPKIYLSYDLFTLASYFEVHDLAHLLRPKEIYLNSTAGGGDCEFVWTVENFSSLKPKKYLQSRNVGSNIPSDLSWCLKLFQNNEKIGIYLVMLDGKPDVDVNVKLFVKDVKGCYVNQQTYAFPYSATKMVGTINFVTKDASNAYKTNLMPNDTLTVVCIVSYSDLKFKNSMERTTEFERNNLDNSSPVDELSQQMANLCRDETESDITVVVEGKEFHVHKAILRARSETLAMLINQLPMDEESLVLPEITAGTMEIILQYIYSGRLIVKTFEAALDVYKGALWLDVVLLRETCLYYLKFNMTPVNSCSAFVSANEWSDMDLKSNVLEYICSNAEKVLLLKEWADLKTTHKNLQREVTGALAAGYRRVTDLNRKSKD